MSQKEVSIHLARRLRLSHFRALPFFADDLSWFLRVEDQDESEAYESKADDESDDGVSAGTEKDTDTDTDTDYAEVKEAETDRSSSDEESVKKSRIRQRRGTSFRRGIFCSFCSFVLVFRRACAALLTNS